MVKLKLFKLKQGKSDTWKEWCRLLETTYREESVETLKEEGLTREGGKVFTVNGEEYVLGFALGEHKPGNMDRQLNRTHREKKLECLEPVPFDLTLYDLEVPME